MPERGKRECQSEGKGYTRDQRRAAAPSGDDCPDMVQPLYATSAGSYSPSVVSPSELSERERDYSLLPFVDLGDCLLDLLSSEVSDSLDRGSRHRDE